MAPFFPSWLGNGTSRRACFMGGGAPRLPGTMAGDLEAVALSEELDERKARFPAAARKGISAVAGLARRAIEAADLVVDSILGDRQRVKLTTGGKKEGKEWRGGTWGGGRGCDSNREVTGKLNRGVA